MRGSPKSGKRRSPGGPRRAPWQCSDELWAAVAPFLCDPQPLDAGKPGRPRVYTPRQCLEGILQLLYTGIRYVDLPHDRDDQPSGETCRRRLGEWIERGVWSQALAVIVEELDGAGRLDWSRVVIDASIVDAKKGAIRSAPARSTARFPVPSTTSRSRPAAGRSRFALAPATRMNAPT